MNTNSTDEVLFSTLRRQGYHIIGSHSAVKRCKWYKESILNRGECYKAKFYGIKSHQCMQSTPCLQFCTHECVFCWRTQAKEIGLSKHNDIPDRTFKWDTPEMIFKGIVHEQTKFAEGYKGNSNADRDKIKEALNPNLLTLSLAGEPTLYPYLGELIKLAKSKGMHTFLVTNATQPHALKRLYESDALPTQLYISMTAPNKEAYLKTCRPRNKELWNRYMESLDIMNSVKGKTRTVLRMTLVRNYNTNNLEGYAEQIRSAMPDYVEVKSFVYVGGARHESRGLKLMDMLRMEEIRMIGMALAKLTGYTYTDEHAASRVAILVRDEFAEEKRKMREKENFGAGIDTSRR